MDPEFMTRYLDQHSADREENQGRKGEPVSEPDIGETPSVSEPGTDLERAQREERTAVLPPDVVAQVRAQLPGPGRSPQQPVSPTPPAPPTARIEPSGADVGEPGRPGEGGTHARAAATDPAAPDVEGGTVPVAHNAYTAAAPPAPAADPVEPAPSRWPGFDAAAPQPPRPSPQGGDPRYASVAPRPQGQQWRAAPAHYPPPQQRSGTGDLGVSRHGDADWPNTAGITESAPWASTAAAPHMRPEELVKTRKLPPEMGWRKVVYVSTGHLVNLGAGPAERTLRDQIALIGSNIPGNYSIGVVSIKGGVGKTRTTAGLGTVYATYRTEPVIAMDANPTYGGLGRLVDDTATASIRDFMADDQVATYPKARSYTGKNKQGLEVLAGNQNVANPLALSEGLFLDTLNRTRRFYQLSLIDCGNHIEHRVMKGVLESVDALVIVTTMNYDGADAAEKTINWLAARNFYELLRRSALVLNDVHHCQSKEYVTKVAEHFEPRVGTVKTVPWDKHLRDGAVLDFEALKRRTQLAYIDLAAWLAQGFTSAAAGVR